MADGIRLVIRTPHEVPFDGRVQGIRVPTETGQVGLRPRGEPLVLVVEPGLIVIRVEEALRFAATAGGLLESDQEQCTVYTPFAVTGSEDEVLAALKRVLETPDTELVARRKLGELEQRIVQELTPSPRTPRRPVSSGG